MSKLYNRLSEEFEDRTGSLREYVGYDGSLAAVREHYDLRAFHGDDITVPRTMIDMNYLNVTALDGIDMAVLDSYRVVEGRSMIARTVGTLNSVPIEELNELDMSDLDLFALASGNENWPIADPDVEFGKDPAERYATSIRIALDSGVEKVVTSMYSDSIPELVGTDRFIELTLPDFPAQAASPHLDLANSKIEFTSGNWEPGTTDSIPFNASLNSLTAGGNTYWRINVESLVNASPTQLTGIRFRLVSVAGDMTFKAQAMRVISNLYVWDRIDIDTKRSRLSRSVPRDSGTELTSNNNVGTSGAPNYIMTRTRPKNGKLLARFNTGHHSTTSNRNNLVLNSRVNSMSLNRLAFDLQTWDTGTQLQIREMINNVPVTLTTVNGPALDQETDYLFQAEFYEDEVRCSVFRGNAALYGEGALETLWVSTVLQDRGYIGFHFNPYNYDFTLDHITAGDAEFAEYITKNFLSHTPMLGATVSASESEPVNLISGQMIAAGDATIEVDPDVGIPGSSVKFTRDGTSWMGGYTSGNFLYIGNPRYLSISGNIYPKLGTGQTALRGFFRVVLLDKNDSVGFIGRIRGLLPSQWNSFKMHLKAPIAPGHYRVLVQHVGFYNETFWIDNLKVDHLRVAWEASPNDGVTWFPFMIATGREHTNVNFLPLTGRKLKVKAIAVSDGAWIGPHEVIPIYGYPGRDIISGFLPSVRLTTSTEWSIRVTGQGTSTPNVTAVRVTGQDTSTTARAIRCQGAATYGYGDYGTGAYGD